MPRQVQLVPYDPSWPLMFRQEQDALSRVLGANLLAIHHIGSTAVPRMSAKPIIDLLVEVRSLDTLATQVSDLAALDYVAKGEHGIAGRRYFQKGGQARTHHLHIYAANHPEVARHLLFRDYLRHSAEARQRYEACKQQALLLSQGDPKVYLAAKTEMITALEQEARLHRSNGSPNRTEA